MSYNKPNIEQKPPKPDYPKPQPCTGNGNPPTQQFVDDYCNKKKDAKANQKAARTAYKTMRTVQHYKRCMMEKTLKTAKIYRNLDYCLATTVSQTTEIVKGNVKKYAEKDKELDTQLKAAVKALKEANKKLNDTEAAAQAAGDAYEDDNSIKQSLIADPIKKLEQEADQCNDLIDDAVKKAILISGIRTFSNVTELDSFATQLSVIVKNFKDDIDKNNTQAVDDLKKAQGEYSTAIKDAVGKQFDWFDSCITFDGIRDTLKFICEPTLPTHSLKEICEKVQQTFNHTETTTTQAIVPVSAYTANDDQE